MKVIGINGSPRANGNTALALGEMAREFAAINAANPTDEPIEMEILHIGSRLIRGCMACGACGRNKDERCAAGVSGASGGASGDPVNEAIQKMKAADAIVLGSPVHYAGIGGTMKSFCDRVFYTVASNGGLFAGKVGASVVAVRRTGGSAAWQGLNYYLAISQMAIAGSSYWSVVHGAAPGEAAEDLEGLQTVRNAAKNIAWMLRARAAADNAAVPRPEYDRGARTNFIR
ncbi:MAG: flavodoxin family protein [Alistipes sp.]|nr:flavodoxin family protein [Alistipes sp.]